MLNIVLVHPEIPQNTGNIARTCAATGAMLHLIEPLGFSLDDRYLKRAGLDYWHLMRYRVYPDWADFLRQNPGARCFFTTKKAAHSYHEVRYQDGDYLVFGRESRGLDDSFLQQRDRLIRIPMKTEARSLNLSNSVAVTLYEALRQLDYPALDTAYRGEAEGEDWQDYL